MGRVLFIVLLVVALVLWWKLRARSITAERRAPPQLPGTMVACAHCGLHLPADEALRDAEARAYCGEAHRLAGPR